MRRACLPSRTIAIGALLLLRATAAPALAQPDVRVVAGDVTDSRFSGGFREGGLSLTVKLRGDGMEGVEALRFLLAEARDDLGNPLLPASKGAPAFRDLRGGRGQEAIALRSPAREATAFLVSGRVELFIPGQDPGAVVKVADALAHPGKPLPSAGLKAAGIRLVVLPRAGQPKEVVSLRGQTAGFDRIRSIRILHPDGTEIPVGSRYSSSDGETTAMLLEAAEPVPGNAALVFTIVTAKACALVPFELKDVPLP